MLINFAQRRLNSNLLLEVWYSMYLPARDLNERETVWLSSQHRFRLSDLVVAYLNRIVVGICVNLSVHAFNTRTYQLIGNFCKSLPNI